MNSNLVLSLIVAALITVIFLAMAWLVKTLKLKQKTKPSEPKTSRTSEAPTLYSFHNPYTVFMLMLCLGLIGFGLVISFGGSFVGVLVGMLGVTIWLFGNTDHPADPPTAGYLTLWSQPLLDSNDDPYIVGGRVILADYWPIYLGTSKIPLSASDRDIKMTIYSKDNVPLNVTVSVSGAPDVSDLKDFIRVAGKKGIDAIFPFIDDIVKREAQIIASELPAELMVKHTEKVSVELEKRLQDQIDLRAFGVKIIKVQFNPDMPEDVKKKMTGKVIEGYERKAELTDYKTYTKAAIERQKAYMKDHERDPRVKVPSFAQCLEEIRRDRLIRDERLTRVETTGKAQTIVLGDVPTKKGK